MAPFGKGAFQNRFLKRGGPDLESKITCENFLDPNP